jgi:hypothetical protein
LLEILNRSLERMFAEWDIQTISEKTQRDKGKPRAKWKHDNIELPPFKLEYLINCVRAYTTQDPQIKTKELIQGAYEEQSKLPGIGPGLQQRLIDMGTEISKSDFMWVFNNLKDEIVRIYQNSKKWRGGNFRTRQFYPSVDGGFG